MLLREARQAETLPCFASAKSRRERLRSAALWVLLKADAHTEKAGGAEGSTRAVLFYRPRRPASYVLWHTPRGYIVAQVYSSRHVLAVWREIARDLNDIEDAEEDAE
jgi:hypothetical protein